MALGRDRSRIAVKGLDRCSMRQTSPSAETSYSELGYLSEVTLADNPVMEEVFDAAGNFIEYAEKSRTVAFDIKMLQSTKDEIEAVTTQTGKYHSLRYYGMSSNSFFQYFSIDEAKITPGTSLDYKPGIRLVTMKVNSLNLTDYNGYTTPHYYFAEAVKELQVTGLNLWIDPRQGLNSATTKVLDMSGFGRVGTLNSDYASIWQTGTTPTRFLRFDGTNDNLSFGDVCDIDDTHDFMIDMWVMIKGADSTLQELVGKKVNDTTGLGYRLTRTAANKIEFKMADGTNTGTVISTNSVLTNVWKHIAVAGDRNGNAQIYINGVADGSAVAISTVTGTCNTTTALTLALFNSGYGQIDVGAFRFYDFGAGGLPSTIATIVDNHYDGEKAYYGLT